MKCNFTRMFRSVMAMLLVALFLLSAAEPALAEQGEDITSQCQFKVTEGTKKYLTDHSYRTEWSYDGQDAQVAIKLPDGVSAGALMIFWMFEPTSYVITEYDSAQNVLRQRDETSTFPNIESMYELLPETAYVFIHLTAADQAITELRVYSEGSLPESAHQWEAPVEKAELMVVSTHQDDELIFFGGTIPYYAIAQQRSTVVVYMANCGRLRRQEALNGLWAMGIRNYPDFINLKDKRVDSINDAISLWGGKEHILQELVEHIRRYKPEVIVTHDLGGEYGHNQHKTTAMAMKYAIDAAADASYFPDSASKYGTWQVKKLYLHLYEENQVHMDWKTPLAELGGLSPLEVARNGYAMHKSQQEFYQVRDGGKNDNSIFGLYFTTVGQDTGINDMFEHIDSEPVATATPEPTVVPTPEPTATAEPTAIATAEPTIEPEPIAEKPSNHGGRILGWTLGTLAVAGGGIMGLHIRAEHRRRRRRKHKNKR